MRQSAFLFGTAQTLLRVGAWLLPWLAVLVVSCGLAYAADIELVQAWPVKQTTTQDISTTSTAMYTPEGEHWVLIEAITEDGNRYPMECLARPGTFTVDDVVLEVSELNAIAAGMCDQLQAIQQH